MTTPVPQDIAARERISTALSETLFVEAGAGTGKTTQLVDRVTHLVTEAAVPLAHIAAITFTEAAASELRDRIREELERAASDAARSPIERRRIDEALADMDLAAISTLHAFAHRLLNEHPVEAGLPPSVEVLDEVSSLLAFEARWSALLDELMDDAAHESLVVRSIRLQVPIEGRSGSQGGLKDLARVLGQNWDRIDDLIERCPSGPVVAPDRRAINEAIDQLGRLTPECSTPDTCTLQRHLADVVPRLDDVRSADDDTFLRHLADRKYKWSKRAGAKKHCTNDLDETREALKAVQDAIDAERARLIDDLLVRFGGLLARFTHDAARQRAADGALEFHDLLVLARRLLRSSATARAALHDRYQRLLLDEFQDTDPIQVELAALVAATVHGELPDWRDLQVEPGRLFFVGDAKQSIYRFRRADLRVFMAARRRFADDVPVELTENFRTVPPIIGWINTLFTDVFSAADDAQPPYAPLTAFRPDDSGADHRPILTGDAHEDATAAEIRGREAQDVARLLRDVQDNPQCWPVRDGDHWRPARMDDVAVLIPARTSLRFLEQALREQGVSYRVDTGALVYDTQEVTDLLAVLAVIDDPTDAVSLVAALRSPLFGCGDDELARFRQGGGSWDLTAPVPEALRGDRVGRGVAWLASLHDVRWWRTPSDLLLTIIERRRAFELAFALDRPRDVWRRLRFLVDQARLFEESEGGDLRDFLAWSELQRHEAARVHEPVLPEADDLSARIMTIHGSKGLEFPITVVSGLSTGFGGGRSGPTVVWDADGRAAIKAASGATTANFDAIADFEEQMESGERLRLLYVALTRARDHLVVTVHRKAYKSEGRRCFADVVVSAVGAEDEAHQWLHDVLARPERPTVADGDPTAAAVDGFIGPVDTSAHDAWVQERDRLRAMAATPSTVSATAVAQLAAASDGGESIAPVVEPIDTEPPGETASEGDGQSVFRRGRAGTAIGRAVHAVLQDGDLAGDGGLQDLCAAAAAAEAIPGEAGVIEARARSAMRSGAVTAALAADRFWRELHVVAPIDGQVVEGYVDLLYQEGDELVVVDYKTDETRGDADVAAKVERYRLQGAAYAVALEQATGLEVRDCRFVFARADKPIERSIVDLDGAKAEVRALLASG